MEIAEIRNLFDRLKNLQDSGEIGNVYSGSESFDADWEVLNEFYMYLIEKYGEMPDWVNAYLQIYSWQYQAFYEGLEGYYENFYGNTDYESIKRTGKYLIEAGYGELAICYNASMCDCSKYCNGQYPIEILDKINKATDWLENNFKEVRDFYFDILFKHKNVMLGID